MLSIINVYLSPGSRAQKFGVRPLCLLSLVDPVSFHASPLA